MKVGIPKIPFSQNRNPPEVRPRDSLTWDCALGSAPTGLIDFNGRRSTHAPMILCEHESFRHSSIGKSWATTFRRVIQLAEYSPDKGTTPGQNRTRRPFTEVWYSGYYAGLQNRATGVRVPLPLPFKYCDHISPYGIRYRKEFI